MRRDYDDMPALEALISSIPDSPPESRFGSLRRELRAAMLAHPAPALAWAETVIWLALILTAFDHLLNVNGTTGTVIWWLTIGPHEIGHLICNPFGTLLMFLGGTIWQVLFWALIGLWDGLVRKRLRVLLFCAAVVGHSFINAAVYIGDAQSRQLPLLFGMSSDHHDWWNILNMLGLLPFDGLLAGLSRLIGLLIIIAAALAGAYLAWLRPLGRR